MAWMRMPGQTWQGAAASFLAMWVVMMVAMMLPSLVPMLWRYRLAIECAAARPPHEARAVRLTAVAASGYFFVWSASGLAVFPVGAGLAAVAMQQPALSRAVPAATAVVVLIAGALQFTRWKARHLGCCRDAPGPGRTLPAEAGTAWRHGLHLGWHCCLCCGGLMAVLLALGVMDLAVMAAVSVAITAERLAPGGDRVARVLGGILVATGSILAARAAGLG
jgi:predicted metal-binding membrane protein